MTTWIENDDGTCACTACGAKSFSPGAGTVCDCKPGDSVVATQEPRTSGPSPSGVGTAAESPGSRLDDDDIDCEWALTAAIPSTEAALKAIHAAYQALRRHRKGGRVLPVEDEYVLSDDGQRGKWRQAWAAEHSKYNALTKSLEAERKAADAMYDKLVSREMPDLLDQMKKTLADIKARQRQMRRQESGEARH